MTAGSTPKASDALAVLHASVGGAQCDGRPCICDVDGDVRVTASDALRVLHAAVGLGRIRSCCMTVEPGCTALDIFTASTSTIDYGSTGIAHGSPVPEAHLLTMQVVHRCSSSHLPCTSDGDCDGGSCNATCDCLVDPECEVRGPVQRRHCRTTQKDCVTNADCPAGVACVSMFLPPVPLSSAGNPMCMVTVVEQDFVGTIDAAEGSLVLGGVIRARMYLGISISQPCPRCGNPQETPAVGDQFTCEGGQFPGAACRVDAAGLFGGTSFDCPPPLGESIVGGGIAVPFHELTTGAVEKTAQLPCANFSFQSHPSRGNGRCIDRIGPEDPTCTSNADCRRCTDDVTVACTTDAQCGGVGRCAEAPEQPVTCGYWCHCGFCDNDPARPCLHDDECPAGQKCLIGTGSGTAPNAPQQKPNDCSQDRFLCDGSEDEKCSTTAQGRCELQPFRNCQESSTCGAQAAGDCLFENRSCFEPRIVRNGATSPLAAYCRHDRTPCISNVDCSDADLCIADSLSPRLVSIGCFPGGSSSTVNSAAGLTGPAVWHLDTLVRICRCGDGVIGCNEECDDGNAAGGDGCNGQCRDE